MSWFHEFVDRRRLWVWTAIGAAGPVAMALALVPLRESIRNANVALVLVAVVVAVATAGGREAGAVAAVSSAAAFDVLHTEPYGRFSIATRDDVETTILLLVVGLVVGHVAARGRHARRRAEERRGEVRRIYRIAELAAKGDDPADVIMATQAELIELLHLRDCRFEASPGTTGLPHVERSGVISWRGHSVRATGFELQAEGAELSVLGRGQVVGHFVLRPTPGTGVSLEQRVVAVALADQVGAALAAPRSGRETVHG